MNVKLYTSTKEVMMDKFIECACHHNYAVLIIEGTPSQEELVNAWIKIKSQHIEVLNNAQADIKIEQVIETSDFNLKKATVQYLLIILSMGYDEDIIEQLREEDYDYPFTEETYLEDIEKVLAELGSESIMIRLYEDSLDTDDESSIPKEENYYETIAVLQKTFGLCAGLPPVRAAKELSVYEFGLFFNRHNQQTTLKAVTEDE